nr:MAG TPA: hypothetical protein [Caudoviricetes sp.]
MFVAGSSASLQFNFGGAITFDVSGLSFGSFWNNGSAL